MSTHSVYQEERTMTQQTQENRKELITLMRSLGMKDNYFRQTLTIYVKKEDADRIKLEIEQ